MSRYIITVTGHDRSDPEAIIGYDPPLRTFFLQAFHHEVTDDPALWLGTHHHAFERLEDLHRAALARGFDFMPLSTEVSSKLIEDKGAAAARQREGGLP